MHKLTFFLLCMAFSPVFGQDQKSKYTELHIGTFQYTGELANEFWRIEKLHAAVGVGFGLNLSPAFDVYGQFSHGIIDYYQFETEDDSLNWSFNTSLYNIELGARYKLNNGFFLDTGFPVTPYLYMGIGGALSTSDRYSENQKFDINIPFGWGITFPIFDKFTASVASTFYYTLSDAYDGWDRIGEEDNLRDRFMFNRLAVAYQF